MDVGVGPAALVVSGPVFADQPVHGALMLSVQAVIDQEFIRKHKKQIPRQYRKAAKQVDEVRISPSLFIPDTLILSPKILHTGIYGVSWRPLSLGAPLLKDPVRLSVSGGLVVTGLFLHSDTLVDGPVFFLRPGLSGRAELEVPLTPDKRWLFSLGWDSRVYPPQPLDGGVLSFGGIDESIWHLGQGYLKIHHRFPYKVKL